MSGKVMCGYCVCEHFTCLDDGEGFAPNLYCEAAEKFLDEDDQECLAPDKKTTTEMEMAK